MDVVVIADHGASITVRGIAVSAAPAKNLPSPANVLNVDLRADAPQRAGTYLFEGDETDAPWHSHPMHQIQYAFEGIAEVESVDGATCSHPDRRCGSPPGSLTAPLCAKSERWRCSSIPRWCRDTTTAYVRSLSRP